MIIIITVEGVIRLFEQPCTLIKSEVYKDINRDELNHLCIDESSLYWIKDPITGFNQPAPNQFSKTITINSDGFRDHEVTKYEPKDVYRIIVVGGSTAFGTGSSDNKTIPSYLEQRLNSAHLKKRVEVMNAGIPSFASNQEVRLIETKLLDYHPDLIIAYDGWNDLALPYGKDPTQQNIHTQFFHFFYHYFPFYRTPYTLFYFVSHLMPPAKINFDEIHMYEKIYNWKNNWINTCKLGKEKDFHVMVVLQPILGSGNKILTEEEKKIFFYNNEDKIMPDYQLFADELHNIKDYCTATADLRNAFDNTNKTVFVDPVHVGEYGNEIVAQHIFELSRSLVK